MFANVLIFNHAFSMDTPSYQGDGVGADAFPLSRNVHGTKLFVFDPKAHAWGAYDSYGQLIATGRASGGADFCADVGRPCRTVIGSFRIYRKQGADCESSAYPKRDGEPDGGAPMPYCMHFHKGYAIHGSSNVPGKNVSHGCIRVTPRAAEWLNKHFIDIGTKVLVLPYSSVGRVMWRVWEKFDSFLI